MTLSRGQKGVLEDRKKADQKQVDKDISSTSLEQLIPQSTKAKQAVPKGAFKRSTLPPVGGYVDDISAKVSMNTRGRKTRASAAAALKRIARDVQSSEMDDHFAEPDETSSVHKNIDNKSNTKSAMGADSLLNSSPFYA